VHAFDRRVAAFYLAHALARRVRDDGARCIGLFGQARSSRSSTCSRPRSSAMDDEVTRGLVRGQTSYTGGTLKWMGVVAPWHHG
jgi:hypothetical protein